VIALRAQEVGQVREPRRERNAEIVDAIVLRIGSGEYGGMRCGGDGNVGVGARKGYPLAGHGIEVGSEAAFRAKESHAIGAGGVEGD
jgi:hypothetical protein